MANRESRTQRKGASSLNVYSDLAERLAGSRAYFAAIILGISVGTLFCIAGFILTLLGISGSVELVMKAVDLEARLINASPGIALAFMGMIIVWRYKPNVSDEVRLKPASRPSLPHLHSPTDRIVSSELSDAKLAELDESLLELSDLDWDKGGRRLNPMDFHYKGSK